MKGKRIKTVAIVTGTRAEYGILKPLITKIYNDPSLELELIVSGMHFLETFGKTIEEIEKGGFPITGKVNMYYESLFGNTEYHGKGLGKGIIEFTDVLSKVQPDMLLVFGDRLEALAATLAAATLNIPIGHIHAGDKTDSGHIDEQIRFSISRFAHLLFAPTKQCAERLIKMGEEPWRVYNVGALGLDSILSVTPYPKEVLENKLNISLNRPTAIVLFHPVIHEYETIGEQTREIMEAIKELNIQSIVIYPNNDLGSEKIINVIEEYSSKLPYIRVFKNLDHELFVSLMHYACVMVGNSSSGIIEAPSFGLPVINIGSRNRGREHGDNVIFVNAKKEEIIIAIKKALFDKDFINKVKMKKNPYGDGKTSERIVKILKNIQIDDKFMRKKIMY